MPDLSLKEYLKELSKEQLQEKWLNIFKSPAPEHLSKSYLVKQIAWSMQYEPLSKDIQNQLDKLIGQYARTKSIRVCDIKRAKKFKVIPGTRFIRELKGIKHEVTALENGFSYNGKTYKSLTAIAHEITGTRWNGKRFFGVDK